MCCTVVDGRVFAQMTDLEVTVDAVLRALGELRALFALAPLQIREIFASDSSWEELSGVDLTIDADQEWKVSAWLDCKIDDVPNVWRLVIERDAQRSWQIERSVEIHPEGEEERTTTRFDPVRIDDARTFAGSLGDLARQLLAVPPPSVTPARPPSS